MNPQFQRFRHQAIPIVCLLAVVGCTTGADEVSPDVGASNVLDGGPTIDVDLAIDIDGASKTDAGVDAADDGVDAAPVVDVGVDCQGPCVEVDLVAEVGAASATFDRAIYGLTAPEQSGSGGWEVHVEVHAGGVDGCPGQNSPTPDQTLIVTGIVWPLETAPFREQDGLIVTLLDFAGTLTNELPLRSTGESLDAFVARVCTDCAGDDPTGFVAFDLVAPVADGEISGHVYATHCASLDVR